MCLQEYAITSDDALVLDEIPNSTIVIVGAGYISVEFSSIYKGLGAEVHLMYRKPLPLTGCAWLYASYMAVLITLLQVTECIRSLL